MILPRHHTNAALKMMWLTIGGLSLVLGGIGAALPVLPTTPFVILAAVAFGKSSPRLQAFLEGHALFGPMIADWRVSGAIATRFKLVAITMMAIVLAVSIAFSAPTAVLVVQTTCMSCAAIFILSRPAPVA
ncbi:MAG: YbaN family protein [Roseibium sp.]